MKKLLKKSKSHKNKSVFSGNRIVWAALAGALTGLAVTYFLESEKGRNILGQVGNSVKHFAGNLKIPALLKG